MRPSSPLGRPIFLKEDAYIVHFSHNDVLVVAIHTGCCKVSKLLIDEGSSVNIMYRHTLDRMEETPELALKMIILRPGRFFMDSTRAKPVLREQSSFRSERIHTTSASSTSNLPTMPSSESMDPHYERSTVHPLSTSEVPPQHQGWPTKWVTRR